MATADPIAVGGDRRPQPDADAAREARARAGVLDRQLVLATRDERGGRLYFDARLSEELGARRGRIRDAIDQYLAIEHQACPPRLYQCEHVLAVVGRRVARTAAHREDVADSLDRAVEEQFRLASLRLPRDRAREVGAPEQLDVDVDPDGWRRARDVAALVMKDLDTGSQTLRERGEEIGAVVGVERGGTTAVEVEPTRVRADDCERPHGVGCEGKDAALVSEQHHRLRGGFAREHPMLGSIDRRFRTGLDPVVERADAVEDRQQPCDGRVQLFFLQLARVHRGAQVVAVEATRSRHLEVEAGTDRADRRADREPVADHKAVEAPFVTQDAREQRLVFGAPRPVQTVVAGHDPERATIAHSMFERNEVDLAQRALVDDRVRRVPLGLRVVGDEVLHGRRDTLRLHTAHERCGRASREQRIFGVALEVAARERRPVHVDRRREQYPARLGARLFTDGDADPLDQLRVPRRTEGRPARDAQRREL